MAQPAPVTTDRLPWLTEVPRTPPPPPKKKASSFSWGWAAAALIILLIGLGAYWLWTRLPDEAAAPPSQMDELTSQAAPTDELPSVSDMTEDNQLPEPVLEEPEAEAETDRSARQDRPRQTRRRTQAAEAGPAPAPAVEIPDQPVVRGRIIQIGAYPTRERADEAWQYVVRKWPYLATKPKLISPIEVRSTDGRGTRMYRLQLATTSQAQSAVICQQLEAAKTSCVVVY